jgi:ABC-type polar amino acid transport system ATPase subunit
MADAVCSSHDGNCGKVSVQPSIISLENVHKWYNGQHVLRGICMTVMQGECVVVCGSSGSGKSTLLRCISGLEEYQKGCIVVTSNCVLPALTSGAPKAEPKYNFCKHSNAERG